MPLLPMLLLILDGIVRSARRVAGDQGLDPGLELADPLPQRGAPAVRVRADDDEPLGRDAGAAGGGARPADGELAVALGGKKCFFSG